MYLTTYSDYALRILLYLSLKDPQVSTIQEIASSYNISKNHLMKIVHHLVKAGYVKSIRGRSGGIMLNKPAQLINIGQVIQVTEENFHLTECFNYQNNQCCIVSHCYLKHILNEALTAFLDVLNQYTLQDIQKNSDQLSALLNIHSTIPPTNS